MVRGSFSIQGFYLNVVYFLMKGVEYFAENIERFV